MAEKLKKTIDIADLSAGDNDILLFSTTSTMVVTQITISGLTGALGNIDLTDSNDRVTYFDISGAQIAVPANGTERISTTTGCELTFAGVRIDKNTATAGIIVIEAASK